MDRRAKRYRSGRSAGAEETTAAPRNGNATLEPTYVLNKLIIALIRKDVLPMKKAKPSFRG
jgi:hypothetical protein